MYVFACLLCCFHFPSGFHLTNTDDHPTNYLCPHQRLKAWSLDVQDRLQCLGCGTEASWKTAPEVVSTARGLCFWKSTPKWKKEMNESEAWLGVFKMLFFSTWKGSREWLATPLYWFIMAPKTNHHWPWEWRSPHHQFLSTVYHCSAWEVTGGSFQVWNLRNSRWLIFRSSNR